MTQIDILNIRYRLRRNINLQNEHPVTSSKVWALNRKYHKRWRTLRDNAIARKLYPYYYHGPRNIGDDLPF